MTGREVDEEVAGPGAVVEHVATRATVHLVLVGRARDDAVVTIVAVRMAGGVVEHEHVVARPPASANWWSVTLR